MLPSDGTCRPMPSGPCMHVCCAIALRLEPHDEYMHELGPEPNFNESMYFNVFDADRRTGGFFRLGNRPNEGRER